MTVGDMEDRMTQAEFVRWQVWHGRKAQRQELEAQRARTGRG